MDQVDVLVVGAGVVGLAAARALASRGRDVIVAEAAPRYGSGVSSRSSEVVHAGLYYEPGSLKARLCVQGRELLYAYCRERGVAHARCGKLVVATRPQDEGRLEAIRARPRLRRRRRRAAGDADRRAGTRARARAAVQRGAAVAPLGHRRQPRADDRAAGRHRGRGRAAGLCQPHRGRRAGAGRLAHRDRRRRHALAAAGALDRQRRRARRAGCRAFDHRVSRQLDPAAAPGQGPLLRPGRQGAVRAPDLPDAGRRRTGRAPDAGPRRRGPLRAGRAVAGRGRGRDARGGARPRGRSGPRRRLLRRGAPLLAAPARQRAAACLCGHPAQARGRRRSGRRFPHRRPGHAWGRRPGAPVRDRVPGADECAGHRRGGCRARLRLTVRDRHSAATASDWVAVRCLHAGVQGRHRARHPRQRSRAPSPALACASAAHRTRCRTTRYGNCATPSPASRSRCWPPCCWRLWPPA
ncbi:MAG: FAD-dependent oxidoreductase [Rubrivivax sp.]|nr:FAD-dependent oxidoreductase [Rubrivivax sp.]MCA3258409.1 FAD-dependent oxidoreductase [Rubrivivax sp.]